MARAGGAERSARLKIQGPSGKGWTAAILPASAASLSVLDAILRCQVGWLEHRTVVIGAQRVTRSRVQRLAGDEAVPVEDAGDEIVICDQRQLADRSDHIRWGAVALTTAPLGQEHLTVNAPDPVDDQHDLGRLRIDPDLSERLAIVVTSVVATANTAVAAIDRLKERGAKDICLVCLIGAPQGLERVRGLHPDVQVWTAAVDEGLDESGYTLPDLGDAGDRVYGTK